MSIQEVALVVGAASTALPFLASYLRRRSNTLLFATGLTGAAIILHMLVLMVLVRTGPVNAPNTWVYLLMASAAPFMIAGYILALGIGRDRPGASLRSHRRTLFLLGAVGAAAVLLVHRESFVAGYNWDDGRGTIHLGSLGKAYLSYLLVGIVFIGYNLESTYRIAPSDMRHHLKLPFLGFFAILGYYTFILTTGILYSSLGLGKLVAAGMPIAVANLMIGYGFLRGALTDVAAPVSRKVVYSSFTAMAAGMYVLAIGIVAQVATFTKWSPDEVVTLSLGFLAVLIAVLLLFSNRFQRKVRRFIDRNFYVNRYDYRSQWNHVIRALDNPTSLNQVLGDTALLLEEIFQPEAFTVAFRDPATGKVRPVLGKGTESANLFLEQKTALAQRFLNERSALLLLGRKDDMEYIPIYAENGPWLKGTASTVVAPLLMGGDLIGSLGLERHDRDGGYTFEDVALLESVATHVASAFKSVKLAEELAEAREMELMSGWSNMLLHDFKNYLSPLRMVARNMIDKRDKPEILDIAARDINRVTDRMETLARTLAELRERPDLAMKAVSLDDMIRDTLDRMHVRDRDSLEIRLELRGKVPALGDESMLTRVLENLIANAVEVMEGRGTLTLRTGQRSRNGDAPVVFASVTDTGPGIPEDFLREKLFHPFATTKSGGTGLGLYQCRSILTAHGGKLLVARTSPEGTTFEMELAAAGDVPGSTLEEQLAETGAAS